MSGPHVESSVPHRRGRARGRPSTVTAMPLITVVGIGADGWGALPESTRGRVLAADVLLGGERQLAVVPAVEGQRREPWPTPLRDGLPGLLDSLDGGVVVLASGDPLVAGIGTTLVDLLGSDAVEIEPALSSAALARARLAWPAETVVTVRDARTLPRHVAPRRRILLLSADERTPRQAADLLTTLGHGASRLVALANLGSAAETRIEATAATWQATPPRLHVLAIECDGPARPTAPGLPDDLFEHDGQLTKRDVRAGALSRLAPFPGGVLWDVGAGAGSVGIEWMLLAEGGTTWAIEHEPARADRIEVNAARLGVPGIRVLRAAAPSALDSPDLPTPDAVFLGGGITAATIASAWSALRPGGVLVAHAVTRETVRTIEDAHADLGGELTRLRVEHVDRLGSYSGWRPARAITQWAARKEFS